MRVFSERLIALVFAIGILVGGIGIGHAGPYEDALAGFTTDEFADTADSVTAVATSGSPLAPALIAALQDGRLLFSAKDKKVFIKIADDKLLDAETGKPFEGTPPDDIVRRTRPARERCPASHRGRVFAPQADSRPPPARRQSHPPSHPPARPDNPRRIPSAPPPVRSFAPSSVKNDPQISQIQFQIQSV